MPTATTAKPRSAKAGVKSAAKASATRAAGRARKTAKPKAKRTKARRARAVSQTRASARPAENVTRFAIADRSFGDFGDYAERAVLIPVGVALTARDRVLSSVNDAVSTYSSTSKAQAQLRRFERRGATARKRLEREVRKTRVRVERELRQRRREIEKTVNGLEDRRDAVAKNSTEFANRVPELATRVPEFANRVQERMLSLV
jgi:hypothetical protein